MTLLLALVLLGPLAVIGTVMAENIAALSDRLRALQGGLPPPDFLADVPLIGSRLTERWRELAADGKLSDEARQILRTAVQWLLGVGAVLGRRHCSAWLSILCAFFFYRDGEAALQRLRDVLGHVAGDRARHLLAVAYGTLKGIVYGVIGSALAQACWPHSAIGSRGFRHRSFSDLQPASSASFPADRRSSGCQRRFGCSGRARPRGASS